MKSLLSDIVQDDGWQLYLVTDEARFFFEKNWQPKVFVEIAYYDCFLQCLTCGDKIHKKFWEPKIRFFAIFSYLVR